MNLLVIAPHQDDEILSAFLLMHNVLEKNGTVNILYATNGDYRGIDYAYTRYYESLNALSLLGICRYRNEQRKKLSNALKKHS